jgi:BolA protein
VSEVVRAIRERLAALDPERVDLVDESALHAGHAGAQGGGGHFRLTIVAECFRGATTVARHRLVYEALAPMMRREIHALAIKALTPQEASAQQPTPSRKEHA